MRKHNITPATIQKAIEQLISESNEEYLTKEPVKDIPVVKETSTIEDIESIITDLTRQMQKAAVELDFELAANLRDQIKELNDQLHDEPIPY